MVTVATIDAPPLTNMFSNEGEKLTANGLESYNGWEINGSATNTVELMNALKGHLHNITIGEFNVTVDSGTENERTVNYTYILLSPDAACSTSDRLCLNLYDPDKSLYNKLELLDVNTRINCFEFTSDNKLELGIELMDGCMNELLKFDIPDESTVWDESTITHGSEANSNGWVIYNEMDLSTIITNSNNLHVDSTVCEFGVTNPETSDEETISFTKIRIWDVDQLENVVELYMYDPQLKIHTCINTGVIDYTNWITTTNDGKICLNCNAVNPPVKNPGEPIYPAPPEPTQPSYVSGDPEVYDFPTATIGGENIHPNSEVIETIDCAPLTQLFDEAAVLERLKTEPSYLSSSNLSKTYNDLNGWEYPEGVTPEDMVNNRLFLATNSFNGGNYVRNVEYTGVGKKHICRFSKFVFYIDGDMNSDPVNYYAWYYAKNDGSYPATAEQIALINKYNNIAKYKVKTKYLYMTPEGKLQFLGYDPDVGNEHVVLRLPITIPFEQKYRNHDTSIDPIHQYYLTDTTNEMPYAAGWEGDLDNLVNAKTNSVKVYSASTDKPFTVYQNGSSGPTVARNISLNTYKFSFTNNETNEQEIVQLNYLNTDVNRKMVNLGIIISQMDEWNVYTGFNVKITKDNDMLITVIEE